jgi:ArsR family transcriptional regulator
MPKRADGRAVEGALRALANDRRLQILQWLKEPRRHFRPQVDGDLVDDGVCGVLIAEKLGVSQPTVSEHLRVLAQAGLLRGKRIKQWTFYKRDEARIAELRDLIARAI